MNLFQPPVSRPRFASSESTDLVPVAGVLASAGITKRKIKKLDAIARAREPHRLQQRAYSSVPFVLSGIPVRRPPHHTLGYAGQNGKFRFRVIGHPDYGLPFGQDRLLLIWIASMATWQKNRVIRFRSAATILETFNLPKDGRCYKRLVAGFQRIFYSTFYFASDDQDAEAVVITRTSFRFVKNLQLWYVRGGVPEDGSGPSPPGERHRALGGILEGNPETSDSGRSQRCPRLGGFTRLLTFTSGWSGPAGQQKAR